MGVLEIVFGFAALTVIVPLICTHWYNMRVKQWEMSLKHTMLERGMSAEEIKSVLEASATKGQLEPGSHPQGRNV